MTPDEHVECPAPNLDDYDSESAAVQHWIDGAYPACGCGRALHRKDGRWFHPDPLPKTLVIEIHAGLSEPIDELRRVLEQAIRLGFVFLSSQLYEVTVAEIDDAPLLDDHWHCPGCGSLVLGTEVRRHVEDCDQVNGSGDPIPDVDDIDRLASTPRKDT
jgi:hypothetical protein